MIKRGFPRTRMPHDRPFLNEDVLINVLSKLPVKSLLRFRCVCKRWRYLISEDPFFVQLHFQQSKSKQPLLFFTSVPSEPIQLGPFPVFLKSTDREANPVSRFEFQFENVYATLLPTCFDLVCIQDDDTVHICNPSTHELITLPKVPFPIDYSSVGFGYVQSTDEYKVVRFVDPDYGPLEDGCIVDPASFKTKCQVFTLGSSWAWKDVADSPYHVSSFSLPAFVNGAIHWLVEYNSMIDSEIYHGHMIDPDNTIIAFDVESEEYRLVPHPEGCPDIRSLEYTELQLVELRGLLCLSCADGTKMDIWMFTDYYYESGNDHVGGTWVKQYSIDLNVLHCSYQMGRRIVQYYVPRDIEDTRVLIETSRQGLGYYHLQSRSFKGFVHSERMPKLQFSFYVESLRSLEQLAQGRH